MEERQIAASAVNDLLFGILSSVFKVSGSSAAAVMRMAGSKILEAFKKQGIELANGENHIEDISEKMAKLFKEANFCDDYKMVKVDDGVEVHVKNCALWGATKQLNEVGIPPYACPYANLSIAVIQDALGQRCRLDSITPGKTEGDSNIHIKYV